jgi:hypothetical protein
MKTRMSPIGSETREPMITRLKTSRPSSSVPKRCDHDGLWAGTAF